MSCRASSKNGLSISSTMLSFTPVKKLSAQITSWPSRTRRSQRCEPRNPAPPVTSTLFLAVFIMLPGSCVSVAARLSRRHGFRQRQPRFDDGIGIERHALDLLLDEPLREV